MSSINLKLPQCQTGWPEARLPFAHLAYHIIIEMGVKPILRWIFQMCLAPELRLRLRKHIAKQDCWHDCENSKPTSSNLRI